MLSEKVTTTRWIKVSYYSEPDSYIKNKMKVELALSIYATKVHVKKSNRCWCNHHLQKGLIQST